MAFGFRMGCIIQPAKDGSRLVELRQSGIVRPAAKPSVASRVVAAGDPHNRGLLPNGGFPVGCISEIRGESSSGRLTVAIRTLVRAVDACERAALVTSHGFFLGLAPGLASALHGVLVCRMRRRRAPFADGACTASLGPRAALAPCREDRRRAENATVVAFRRGLKTRAGPTITRLHPRSRHLRSTGSRDTGPSIDRGSRAAPPARSSFRTPEGPARPRVRTSRRPGRELPG